MKQFDSVKFLEWVVWYSNQHAAKPTPIRLVKFLYLVDLYNARTKPTETLTGWTWRFVHYGPFCTEAFDAVEGAQLAGQISGEPYQSKFDKETKLYSFTGDLKPKEYPDTLPLYVGSEIKHAVKCWCHDTYGLLDHVYFHTEPMSKAQPGEVLDFSVAEMPKRFNPAKMKRLSKKRLTTARAILKRLAESHTKTQERTREFETKAVYDDIHQQSLRKLDEGEDPIPSEWRGRLDLSSL